MGLRNAMITAMSAFCLLQYVVNAFCFVNLSFNKTVDMSSSQYNDRWLADVAVDGDISQVAAYNSCAVTSPVFQRQAWWRVDLGDEYVLNSVKIFYRNENESQSRTYHLSGFSIYVADTLNWWIGTRCYIHNNGQYTNPGPNDILSVPCNATGRYVTVYNQRNNSCSLLNPTCARLELCEVEVLGCDDGTYGESCRNNCSGNCFYGDHCNKAHGGCDDGCAAGYRGFYCNDAHGGCNNGCAPGYRGFYCDEACPDGNFGLNCSGNCSENCNDMKCRKTDGYCEECQKGWKGYFCDETCPDGNFGLNCSGNCSENCNDMKCRKTDGYCEECQKGWKGYFCDEKCSHGFYGNRCLHMCKSCTESCHHVTGECLVVERQTYFEDKDGIIVVISVISVIVITNLIGALLITCMKRNNEPPVGTKQISNISTTQQRPRRSQISNIHRDDMQDAESAVNQVSVEDYNSRKTYMDMKSTITYSNTYESLKQDREVTYVNTELSNACIQNVDNHTAKNGICSENIVVE